MNKKVKPQPVPAKWQIKQTPHCDSRVLHAPGECEFCDKHPEWQALRFAWGIAFTGYEPDGTELPDPATYARGDNINSWPWNRASKVEAKNVIVTDGFKEMFP